MSKTLKIILGVVLLLVVVVFVVPLVGGIMSTVKPKEAIESANRQKDSNLLIEAIAESLEKEPEGVTISVDKSMDNKKIGTVTFPNDSEKYWFISLKMTDGNWWVLGSGGSKDAVTCSMVDDIYPAELVPTCFDTKTQKFVKRN